MKVQICFPGLALLALFCADLVCADDLLVKRDLGIERGRITQIDSQWVGFADGRKFGWQDVLDSNLKGPKKQTFDKYLRQIGIPLFRCKQKLRYRDFQGLPELAEQLYSRMLSDRDFFSQQGAFLVCASTFQSRINRENFDLAVEPWIRLCQLFEELGQPSWRLNELGLSRADLESGVTEQLLPIWRHSKKLAEAIQSLDRLATKTRSPADNSKIYYLTSMQIAQKNLTQAKEALARLRDRKMPPGWLEILQCQLAIEQGRGFSAISQLDKQASSFTPNLRAFAKFMSGVELGRESDSVDLAVLQLLEIPASGSGPMYLSAASLFEAQSILNQQGRMQEAGVIREMLVTKYATSSFAALTKQQQRK